MFFPLAAEAESLNDGHDQCEGAQSSDERQANNIEGCHVLNSFSLSWSRGLDEKCAQANDHNAGEVGKTDGVKGAHVTYSCRAPKGPRS